MRRFLEIFVCLCLLQSFCGSAIAAPHHGDSGKSQAQSDATAESSPGSQDDASKSADEKTSDDSTGTDSKGTVKVNNLANLEALLNILANGVEILGVAVGGPLCLFGVPAGIILLFFKGKRWFGAILLVLGPIILGFGLATPGIINWLVASARDGGLFN